MKITHFADTAAASSSDSAPSGPAGGDLGGTYPNPPVTGLQGNPICTDTPATNEVLTWDGTQWCPAPTAGGLTGFAVPAIVLGTAAAAGAATTVIRSDSTIVAFGATVPTTSAVGDAAATGSVALASRRDHRHGRESFASPAIVLGSAAAAGVATTPIRSDATIAAFGTAIPLVDAGSGATGSAALASREDHVHPLSTGTHAHIDNVTFSGDGSTTVFELPAAPVDAFSVGAYVAGVRVSQSLSGTLLTMMTFDAAPASGTNNVVVDIAAVLV